ncbi:DNA primase [Sediminimonas sp.]|uniref:DNA primase n=1 Tax=Sediminimonas sp. TaxID=2823379 RepID=UPI0025EA5804|nr:DNA primase [Sediminimonas sp.]
MSLPPGFLDELRTRLSLSQVVGRKVIWDSRKSNQAKGDMWAPCPFHQEKTASFHVDDRKGFYYCFGCQAKGDVFSFVRETENVEFMEAVEILAREAGMPMPARDPQAQQKADRRSQLAEVMEMAVRHFRLQLQTQAGAAARDYLVRRGLDQGAQDRFEIGFAPDRWQGLWEHLKTAGVAEDMILDCGLAKTAQSGERHYDTFRGRIMFPIRDGRGRCIAFGGRAMDPADNAKYLNSPETLLFDKGRSLYNHAPAREAAGNGQTLIVAEGYMDVIALVEAGFAAAVAPLGTAITESQLQLLWRIAPEPVVALDGDAAGLRAAYRLIDLALPLLESGRSLRFAVLPPGKDPDDLLREGGARAMQALVDQAMPTVDLLWQRETEGRRFDSPERRAALDKALRDKLRLISDPSLRRHYGEAIKEKRWQLFNPRRAARQGGAGHRGMGGGRTPWLAAPTTPMPGTKSSLLVSADAPAQEQLREAVILAALVCTPEVIAEFEPQLERMDCHAPDHAALRDLLLDHAGAASADALRAIIVQELGEGALEKILSLPHVAISPPVRHPGDAEKARMTVAEELAKIDALRGLDAEVAEAQEDVSGLADEALTWRLHQAAETRNRALRSQQEDRTEYDTGPNGARINRSERSALDTLLSQIDPTKPRR